MTLLVYKSSAGSGKTYTLVKEYIKWAISENNEDYFSSILAITFTNKAAAEMKERLLDTLYRASFLKESLPMIKDISIELNVTEEELKIKLRKLLKNILHKYYGLNISTIDKFTYKLLRSFASDIQFPSDFKVTTNDKEIILKAVEEVISKSGEDLYITTLLKNFNEYLLENESSFGVSTALTNIVEVYLKDDAEEKLSSIEKLKADVFESIYNISKQKIEDYKTKLKTFYNDFEIATQNVDIENLPYKKNGFPSFFKKLLDPLHRDFLLKHNNGNLDKYKRDNINSDINYLFNLYFETCTYIEKEKPEIILYKAIYDNILTTALVAEICKTFQKLITEETILPVSEFNKKINSLIKNETAPFIFEKTGTKFNHFMIDEFQDTSKKQWHNFLPLIEDSLAKGKDNLLVGDAKQSIYRWRGASVDQFSNLPELNLDSYSAVNENRKLNFRKHYSEVILDKNFRSLPNIVEFNNSFFEFVKNQSESKIKNIYNNNVQKIVKTDGEKGLVKFCFNDNEEDYIQFFFEKIEKIISEAIKLGYEYKDIAILVRKNQLAKKIAEHLVSKCLPVLSKESFSLIAAPKINICYLTIKLIYFPDDKLNRLNLAKAVGELLNRNYFEDEILRENIENEKNGTIKIFEFKIKCKKLIQLSLYNLVREILNIYGFINQTDAYVISLLDVCYKLDSSENFTPTQFINLIEEGKDFNIQIPDELNAINILTIHKSKGLQFPVVIIPECDWETSNKNNWLWINTDKFKNTGVEDFVIKSSKILENSSVANYYAEEKENEALDNLNLLYVAFTRAENVLYGLFKSKIDKIKENNDGYNFAKLIKEYFNENKEFSIGTFPKNLKKSNQFSNTFDFSETNKKTSLNKNFQIAPKSISYRGNLIEEKKSLGIQKHTFLEKITHKSNFQIIVNDNKYLSRIFSNEEIENLKFMVFESEINYLFNDNTIHKSEFEVCSINGRILRIDRLIKTKEEYVILDFKTGKINEKDKIKIKEYLELILQTGLEVKTAILYYLSERKAINVNR